MTRPTASPEPVASPAPAGAGLAAVRLRLDVAYDGTDFSGWATQPGRRTVAGVICDALAILFDDVAGMTVAGRTDAGVHATGQVCHVDVPSMGWALLAPTLVRRLAALLPPDVRVTAVAEVPPTFDARFSAVSRRYEYRVSDLGFGVDPLRRRDTLAWPRPLDLALLTEASAGLRGEHDFAAYCRRKEQGTTVRSMRRFEWRRDGGVLVASVEADAFCQAMVRSLVGALLAVGDGRQPVDWPVALLARAARASEVTVAPAHGLTLVAVTYAADFAARAVITHRVRA